MHAKFFRKLGYPEEAISLITNRSLVKVAGVCAIVVAVVLLLACLLFPPLRL